MTKATARKVFREQRAGLTSPEVHTDIITKKCVSLLTERPSLKTIHCFLSVIRQNEIPTGLLIEQIRAEFSGMRIIVPVADFQTFTMKNILWETHTVFQENAYGIPEPVGGRSVHSEEIDIVLVPLLAFDESGFRVGYGKGFYDKFLADCRPNCLKVGLSFFSPIKKIEDILPTDIRLDACITPEKNWWFGTN